VREREARLAAEAEVRRRFDAGDLEGAMTAAIEGFGAELFGFLLGLSRDHDRASDAFGATCERMWRGLPTFRWDSPFPVWAYTIARHEFLRSTRTTARERKQVALSQAPSVLAAVDRVRTNTPLHQQTAVKEVLARVREGLDPEDHMLLGLRLDRKLPWNEIAAILGSGDPAELRKEAAALRKRFERLKERLRTLVTDARED
jgi:RNA polymerase sigma factor (sigma-70 family)